LGKRCDTSRAKAMTTAMVMPTTIMTSAPITPTTSSGRVLREPDTTSKNSAPVKPPIVDATG
jgi:hypothetical protein